MVLSMYRFRRFPIVINNPPGTLAVLYNIIKVYQVTDAHLRRHLSGGKALHLCMALSESVENFRRDLREYQVFER